MARGVTLGVLINDLRSEIGHSLQTSLGKTTRDVLINTLQRTQKRLWDDYAWSFLKVKRSILIQNNQRYYDMPSDVVFERIVNVEFKHGDMWERIEYGINSHHYNAFDSDNGVTSYPVQRYDNYENNQIEVFPVPNKDGNSTTLEGTIRVHGIKNLSAFVAESDTADLDDQLLILFSAAEMLSRQKQQDYQNKLAQAQAHYARLKARNAKSDPFVLSGHEPDGMYTPKRPFLIAPVTS